MLLESNTKIEDKQSQKNQPNSEDSLEAKGFYYFT